MKWIYVLISTTFLSWQAYAQQISSYTFAGLEDKIKQESKEQTLIINFWATWCAPCIRELPYFESLTEDIKTDQLKVILVSLDMEKERAETYAMKKGLQSEVLYLDEVDFNQWIDSISPEWSGAIPATLMVAPSGKKEFFEGAFTKEELYDTVKRFVEND
jgi:thiol-disulfide isomerase/thioredoxin